MDQVVWTHVVFCVRGCCGNRYLIGSASLVAHCSAAMFWNVKNKWIITWFQTVVGRIFASENNSYNERCAQSFKCAAKAMSSTPSPPTQCWNEELYFHLRNFCRSNAPPTKQNRSIMTSQHCDGGKGHWNCFLLRMLFSLAKNLPTTVCFFISISCL